MCAFRGSSFLSVHYAKDLYFPFLDYPSILVCVLNFVNLLRRLLFDWKTVRPRLILTFDLFSYINNRTNHWKRTLDDTQFVCIEEFWHLKLMGVYYRWLKRVNMFWLDWLDFKRQVETTYAKGGTFAFQMESSDRCDFVFILTAWIVMVLMDAGRSMSLWRVPPISWT